VAAPGLVEACWTAGSRAGSRAGLHRTGKPIIAALNGWVIGGGEITEDGGSASIHSLDIRDEAAVIETVVAILGRYGRIDGLVNNAGGQYRAPLREIATKGFEAVVRTNLTGGFIVMREVYNRWMAENDGAIVNMIADTWHGWPHFSHSAASRGGMFTLSECAATEWA
jgi:citronellol/citronellal dehydrogenase